MPNEQSPGFPVRFTPVSRNPSARARSASCRTNSSLATLGGRFAASKSATAFSSLTTSVTDVSISSGVTPKNLQSQRLRAVPVGSSHSKRPPSRELHRSLYRPSVDGIAMFDVLWELIRRVSY